MSLVKKLILLMVRPSLQASPEGIQSAKQALANRGLMQKNLVTRIGCSRHPVIKFFKGELIEQSTFIRICGELELDWQEIADLRTALVQELRKRITAKVQEQCGTMRVLDMSRPIELSDIYTSVNVLEKISGRKRQNIEELRQESNLRAIEVFGLGRVAEDRVPGLDAVEKYKKVIVLGKPGAGKTTFLKYTAMQCIQGKLQPNKVPVFVTLKDFAESGNESSLLEYISQQFSEYDMTPTQIHDLLQYGAALILLDGLDEVRAEYQSHVLKEIRSFSNRFSNSGFIISCRLAAWDYVFDKFTEVEVADFDDQQVYTFANNWFKNKLVSSQNFIKHLKNDSRIRQLAVSPLLLTLLCLAFEESGVFPRSRSELYKEGLDVFLRKWDAKRGIHRNQVYKQLSPQRKEDLLSQIAINRFTKGEYYFKQVDAEHDIVSYIRALKDVSIEPESLQADSEAVLHSIESQHGLLVERAKGIYSFSHLSFHEYFTAREIVIRQSSREEAIQELTKHIADWRWREVFLLATEMFQPDASMLLKMMKQKIDSLLAGKEKLQEFLGQVDSKAMAHQLPVKSAAVRAFYFDPDFELDSARKLSRLIDPAANYLICASFFTRVLRDTKFEEAFNFAKKYDESKHEDSGKIITASSADEIMHIALTYALESDRLEPKLRSTLQEIYDENSDQLENNSLDEEKMRHLADDARQIAKGNFSMGEDWRFSKDEKQLLKQYYSANRLLAECLQSECRIEPENETEILEALLLPLSIGVEPRSV